MNQSTWSTHKCCASKRDTKKPASKEHFIKSGLFAKQFLHCESSSHNQQNSGNTEDGKRKGNQNASLASAAIIIFSVLASPWNLDIVNINSVYQQPALTTIQVSRSDALALTDEQLLISDVWKEVTRQYVDPSFNGLGEEKWKKMRLDAVKAIQNVDPDNKSAIYDQIRNMLKALGDPYTRFLTPDQFESLTIYAKGGSSGGVGIQLIVDPSMGKVVVINTSPDSPAAKGGILPGDVILDVDGVDMASATAEVVASACRGDPNTSIQITVKHDGGKAKPQTLTLTRSIIKNNPVQMSTFTVTSATSNKKATVGVLKVSAFSQVTVSQMVDGLRDMTKGGKPSLGAIIVDVRGNAGGYMPAGVDAASLFLKPNAVVISEVNKSEKAKVYLADGIGSETDIPLYMLVDSRTASASEIMTAALQDNGRATVAGTTKTFGKGRIQNVQGPLIDGSGLAVTKAKYMTPNGRDIHGVGITPNVMLEESMCGSDDDAASCLSALLTTNL
jgi:carboxyl-terminal processing protease